MALASRRRPATPASESCLLTDPEYAAGRAARQRLLPALDTLPEA
ncbi:hypothetical protein [Streptomyces avermitilis]